MADKSPSKPGSESGSEKKNGTAAPDANASRPGGFSAWAPLLANLILMPVLGFATFTFLIQPKLGLPAPAAAEEHGEGEDESGGASAGGAHGAKAGAKGKVTTPLPGKILVNVAGTQGTRYLLANVTLVSAKSDLKELVEKFEAQLKDAASSALASKTIPELEKPGARNVIRSELISVFNNVLGDGAITELYITEFAIQ